MTREEFLDALPDVVTLQGELVKVWVNYIFDFADSHPAWVSVENELPPHRNQTNHKFENDFSVNCFVSDGKDVDTGYYDYRLRKWNCEFLTNVVYWYRPQLPSKED